MKCPVCKTDIHTSDYCTECGFDKLNPEFVNREEAESWMQTVVWPYREDYWLRMKWEFRIVNRCLTEFDIELWKKKNPNATRIIPQIPYGVTEIGRGVFSLFSKTNSIDDVEIPSSVKRIGSLSFSHCKLNSLILPSSVREIESAAFASSQFNELILNDGLEIIGKEAFHSTCLKILHIPASVTRIDDGAFYSVNRITLAEDNKCFRIIAGCLYDNAERLIVSTNRTASTITIQKWTKTIAESAFSWNQCIKTLVFTEGVQEIREFAATQCHRLQTAVIPHSVKTVGKSIFAGCKELRIFCEAKSKPAGWDDNWNAYCDAEVFWGGAWYYDELGMPALVVKSS